MKANLFTLNDQDFWRTDSGALECRECQDSIWCAHIEEVIKSNLDAETISDLDEQIKVPIFPTAAMWANCLLDYIQKLESFKVYFIPEHVRVDDIAKRNYDGFIGFLGKGEGRGVIRSMILDWFKGTVDTEGMLCPMSSHGFAAQVRWERDMQDPTKAFIQQWAVWSTSKCLGCSGTAAAFDDLIPDDDRAPSPWTR